MNSIRDIPIIPPPDLRNIVDKTASFVARNGPEFESRIQQNEQSNPKFNFLKPGDPYNSYYQFKVREIREGNFNQSNAITNGEVKSTAQPTTNLVQSKLIKSFAEKVYVQDPPPEYEFMIEPPSTLAQDLDIIKLTAQFVAIHGRSFLTNLMNREQRNYQFDFLRPQHGLFSYFTQLIEEYTKIINQGKEILDELRKDLEPDFVWRKIKYRYEWTKIKEAEKQKEQEEIEKERMEYAQIDWHDFVVVETVDYQFNEQGIFPPPTTPEQVGSRILIQQRIEEEQQSKQKTTVNQTNVEMDLVEDLEKEIANEESAAREGERKDQEIMPPPTANFNNVIIRKDYDPKQAKKQTPSNASVAKTDGWVISPITNERIPAEKLAEHMRYGLLDPRWVEQRERTIQEKLQQEEVFAPGVAIESSLKQMAERRTDIFGVGIDETEIGKKIGEEESRDKSKDKVTWDGYSSSMESAAKAARANITIEDQIQQIHKMKGLVEEDNKDKIGPAIVPTTKINQQIHSMNATIQMPPSNQVIINKQMNKMLPQQMNQQMNQQMSQQMNQQMNQHMSQQLNQQMTQSTQQRFVMPQPPTMHHPTMPSMPPPHHMNPAAMMQHLYPPHLHSVSAMHPNLAHPFMPPAPAPPIEPPVDLIPEPATKKQRTEENLKPEEEFLASHSGTLSLNISVPNIPDKPELNMNGQTLSVTLNLTDMVSVIKSKINEQIGLAPGKQKLQYEGIFIKDSNTLAYYNMLEGSLIQLALKERGGKKR